MSRRFIRIRHAPSGSVIAEGPIGWEITPFEGNYYIRRKCLVSGRFHVNYIPGLCIYKFLYVWLDFVTPEEEVIKNLAWKYWLPNPLFPFIWYRVGIAAMHPDIQIEEYEGASEQVA